MPLKIEQQIETEILFFLRDLNKQNKKPGEDTKKQIEEN